MSALKVNTQTRASFVRKSVEENEVTKSLIDSIMPYFPKGNQIIGGWVDDSKQYWKTNFHWEYLLRHLDKAKEMNIAAEHVQSIDAIRAALVANSPNPDKGYTQSRVMGQPKDQSSRESIIQRWKTLKQCKKDFKRVLDKAELLKNMEKKEKKVWLLALAPVAKPGTSKHSTGYAVDIYGDNNQIVKISKELGASLVFPEGSHVHVEFANGVAGKPYSTVAKLAIPAFCPADIHYTDNACVLSPSEFAELVLDCRNATSTGLFAEEIPHLGIMQDLFNDKLETWIR